MRNDYLRASIVKKGTMAGGHVPQGDISFQTKRESNSKIKKQDVHDGYSPFKPTQGNDDQSFHDLLQKKQQVSLLQQTVPDQPSEFFEDDLKIRSALENQKLFLKKYSIDVELPVVYVLDAQINHIFPDYCIQLIKVVVPQVEELLVKTNFQDGRTSVSTFNKLLQKYKDGLVLRLLHRQENQLVQVRELVLEGINCAQMRFSQDGTHFALMVPEHPLNKCPEQVRICKMVKYDINEIIFQLQHKKYQVHYPQLFVHKIVTPNNCVIQKLQLTGMPENTKQKEKKETMSKDISFVSNVKFDQNNRFLVGYGLRQIIILNIEQNTSKQYEINSTIYERIYDINLCSSSDEMYKCFIACKRKVINQIVVFDLREFQDKLEDPNVKESPWYIDENLDSRMTLNFANVPTDKLTIVISNNFKQVVFTDAQENFILQNRDGFTVQKKLTQLDQKFSLFTKESPYPESGFYFIQCKDYDKSFKIIQSNREKKITKIVRNVEPNILKVFDFHIVKQESEKKGWTKRYLRILSLLDDQFFSDFIEYDEILIPHQRILIERLAEVPKFVYKYAGMEHQHYEFSGIAGFSCNWPYTACTGYGNYLILVNAFEKKFIQRIQLGEESQKITICDTYITDTYDLFILIQNQQTYKLYMIDLDAANEMEQEEDQDQDDEESTTYRIGEPIYAYHSDDVQKRQFLNMYARGSSRKEKYDKNEKLFVYFLHEGALYSWTQLTKYSRFDEINFVTTCQSKQLLHMSHGNFVFLQGIYNKTGKLKEQKVCKLQTNFSMYQIVEYIVRSSDCRDKIQEISFDHQQNNILLLIQIKQISGESDELQTYLKLFDIEVNRTIAEISLSYDTLIGRLKSGLFLVNDGYIYYNNSVIKMRVDLIRSAKSYKYKEVELFDFYDNIFSLGSTIQIRSGTPLDSIRYHRFIYVTRDKDCILPVKIMMLPYLHQRRIYLNRLKDNTNYFYTSIDTPLEQESKFRLSIKQMKENDSKKSSWEIDQIKLSQGIQKDNHEIKSAVSIICMNLNANKYYVYDPNGILQKRVDYNHIYEEYGVPIATSSNGQLFIFQKTMEQLELLQNLNREQIIQEYTSIHIFKLSVFRLQLVKKVDIIKNIRDYLLQQKSEETEKINWLFNLDIQALKYALDMKMVVNDRMHFCVRLNIKNEREYNLNGQRKDRHQIEIDGEGHQLETHQIYYFENCIYNLESETSVDQKSEGKGKLQSVLITDQHAGYEFIINRLYIFFWSDSQILYGLLSNGIDKEDQLLKANISIDDQNPDSYFKDVRTGSNPEMFIFVIQQSIKEVNSIYTWSTLENAEAEAYDVNGQWEILWDKTGSAYIINGNKVILNNQRCSVKTYDFQELEESKSESTSTISNDRGHRFDFKNHNWLIFKQYISLGFSYITFVIKDKIENNDPSIRKNLFDPMPYNYIFNKSTSFLDDDFVFQDHEQVAHVLHQFSQIDPDLLELLVYNQIMLNKKKEQVGFNTPLLMAVINHNNRSADIILDYMSRINFNSSRNIMSVISKLVNYKQFIKYLTYLPVQTPIMEQKQVFRVKSSYDEKIISFCETSCIQIDEAFYRNIMQEVPMGQGIIYKSYPVQVVAIRIAWILEQKEGKQFLQAIYNNENLQYYKIPTVYLVVEFLYRKYKGLLLKQLLPAFLLQATFFQVSVYLMEAYFAELLNNKIPDENGTFWISGSDESYTFKMSALVFLVLNSIGVFVIFIPQWLLFLNLGKAHFKSFYSLVDVAYISINIVITFLSLYQLIGDSNQVDFDSFKSTVKAQRNLEAICIFLLYTKNGYFMSLIDATAPLIDNITEVIWDIRFFIVVLMIQGFAFALSFFIIAQNQLDFDDLSDEDLSKFEYDTIFSAIWYVYYNFVASGRRYSSFNLGDQTQRIILYIIYIVAANYIIMILLNMLIALMQKTFASRRVVAEQVRIEDHLKFVLDNWHLIDFALKDKTSMKYIIAALAIDDSESKDIGFINAKDEIKAIDAQSQENFNKLNARIYLNTLIVQSLKKDQDDEFKKLDGNIAMQEYEKKLQIQQELNEEIRKRIGQKLTKIMSKKNLFN